MYDLIVIGGGPGGYDAAAHAAKLGKKVALVERERVGGTCLNVGCIPAKTFLRSSKLYHEVLQGAPFGVHAEHVTFNLPAVVQRKNQVVGTLTRGVSGMLKRTGVEVIAGTAKLAGRGVVAVGADRLETANVLIATGSRPAVPPIPGIDSAGVLDSTAVFEMTTVPARVAIIGGGYIGLEFACFFREIGADVAVYEMLPQIASGSDGDISSRLLRILAATGISFNLSCRVVGIEGQSLRFVDSAGAEATTTVDCMLNATGRLPVVNDLGLEDLGLDFGPRGIVITDQGRTNVPGIWACGDVTGKHMLAHVATREGIVAVNCMFGVEDHSRYHAVPSVIYTHPEVAAAGLTEEQLKAAGVPYKKATVPMAVAGRFLVENEGGSGMVKVLAGATYGELLGVHAIGDLSSEFIVAAAAMIEMEMTVAQAGEVIFPHPTVSEALREAILAIQ